MSAIAIAVSGCATTSGKPAVLPGAETVVNPAASSTPNGVEVAVPGESYGPPAPSFSDTPTTTYGPEPILFRPVVLVLGPGLARGYAYVGAIRALIEAKIPIGAILGTEMGALIGSLYAMDAKINQFEWALLKFREGAFETQGGLLPEMFQRSARAKKLEEGLRSVFDTRDLNQSKVPLKVAIQNKDGVALILERGPAVNAVRAAISNAELFGAGQWNGDVAESAAKTRPFLITEAKAMNLGPVIVIDAMEPLDEKTLVNPSELKEADLVIRPELGGIGALEFQKRTDAAFRGKRAVTSQITEIKHLVGMPTDAEPPKGNP